ncbi:MAG: hypothetical protein ACOCS7_02790 [Halolamina sp.]
MKVSVGQKVKEGDTILTLEPAGEDGGEAAADDEGGEEAEAQAEEAPAAEEQEAAKEAPSAGQDTGKVEKADRDSAPAGEEPTEPPRVDSGPRSSPTASTPAR